MKSLKLLLVLVTILAGAVVALGGGTDYVYRQTVENFTPTYWQDTTWFPPGSATIRFTEYSKFELQFRVLNADTLVADTLTLSLYTGTLPIRDSSRLWYSLPNHSPVIDDDTSTFRWIFQYPDSCYTDQVEWPDRYVWLRILHSRTHQGVEGASADAGTLFVEQDVYCVAKGDSVLDWNTTSQLTETKTVADNGDLWSAAGDSLADWNSSSGGTREGDIDEGIAALDTADYIFVLGSDTTCMIALENTAQGTFMDSLVFTIVAGRESTTVAACTLGIALAIGDSALHHYDSVTVGTQQNFSLNAVVDTLTIVFLVDPYSGVLDKAEVDSFFVVFDAVHVDTTADGGAAQLNVYLLDVAYKAEGTFYTEIDEPDDSVYYTDSSILGPATA